MGLCDFPDKLNNGEGKGGSSSPKKGKGKASRGKKGKGKGGSRRTPWVPFEALLGHVLLVPCIAWGVIPKVLRMLFGTGWLVSCSRVGRGKKHPEPGFATRPSSDFERPVAAEHGQAMISTTKQALCSVLERYRRC